MSQPKIRIFTTNACPYCYTLKEFLKEKNIEFEEIDVLKDARAREEIIKKSGQMAVPIIDIEGKIIVGFDKEKISNLLGIKD